jgi:hypothetical protein
MSVPCYPTCICFLLDMISGKNVLPEKSKPDAAELIKTARYHKLTYALLRYAHKYHSVFSAEETRTLERITLANSSKALLQLHELLRLCEIFGDKGISYVVIKGPQLSRMLFGKEVLKESADLDIMLDGKGQFDEVRDILEYQYYQEISASRRMKKLRKWMFIEARREVVFVNQNNGIVLDLHLKPAPNAYLTSSLFRGFLADKRMFKLEDRDVPVLQDEKYFVFLCHHGALHQFARLGWLNDIKQFLIVVKPDLQKALEIAKHTGTQRSMLVALRLIDELSGGYIEEKSMPGTGHHQVKKLACASVKLLCSDPRFIMSFRGRLFRLRYLLRLSRSWAGKIDVITGIILRVLIKAP